MIPVLTTAQMRAIDKQAIGGNRSSGFSYMLKAGMGLYDAIIERVKKNDKIAIVCGKGNNAGDGFVVARMLIDEGYQVMCFMLAEGESLKGEARQAYDEYVSGKGNYMVVDDVTDLDAFSGFALIIDAVLGVGITGDPHGMAAEIIEAINRSPVPVIAVDTPSGLNCHTGAPGAPTVRADVTITMGFPKIGLLMYPGRSFVGKLRIRDLSYPEEIVAQNQGNVYLPTIKLLRKLLPHRHPAGSKFRHGLALIVAGSRGMTGSASLAAMASLRTGCGMAHLASPQSTIQTLAQKLTEPVLHPMPDSADGHITLKAIDALLAMAEKMHAALIGPGLSHHQEAASLVRELVAGLRMPVVLDADGINAYKGRADELKKRKCPLLITPHEGEWRRLFEPLPPAPVERIETLCAIAREYDMDILYKGNPTLAATSSGVAYIVPIGNTGMASAGSGDVLSGILVSLLAQGAALDDAAALGACIHGMAGEMASRDLTEYSVIAGDIIDRIPKVLALLAPAATPGIIPEE